MESGINKDNIKDLLLEHRATEKITQAEISKKAGISLPTIIGIESGSLTPQNMTIFKLQKYFNSIN